MKQKFLLLTILFLTSISNGCMLAIPTVSSNPYSSGGCYKQNFDNLLEHTELKKVFTEIAQELCVDSCNTCNDSVKSTCNSSKTSSPLDDVKRRTVLVTDFVDIQTFVPKQQGILMGELMRSSLNTNCCYRIVQAEFAKYFKLSENGLVVLSRNTNEIKKNEYNESDSIVGTYSVMNNKLIIFVRIINTTTGKISKMVTRELTYNCSGDNITYSVH